MRGAAWIAVFILLAGCQPDPLGRPLSQVRADEAKCAADGGAWKGGGITGAMMCFRTTLDAGKSCSKESDCSGMCLSDTRTCSTVSPMFGCIPHLDEDGQEVEICID